jgi:SagB-type dehydrogenase family enzyme
VSAAEAEHEQELPLAVWEFHDLLFHARSRGGRHFNPLGGTYRFAGRIDPAPVLPPPRSSRVVELGRPDFDRLAREDPPLSAIQAARRSIRRYAEPPVDIGELAEFLFRVARLDDLVHYPGPDAAHPEWFAVRPYPAGGALYELECYVGVVRCGGLAPGLYHYDAGNHRLEVVCGASAGLDELLAIEGRGAMIGLEQMQVFVLLTARMHRIAWKYAGLAYALVLKHVGVLYDQMYLAATAMGLAPCAVGGGDSDLFARVSGLDYYEEPLVGEFALGRAPAES